MFTLDELTQTVISPSCLEQGRFPMICIDLPVWAWQAIFWGGVAVSLVSAYFTARNASMRNGKK